VVQRLRVGRTLPKLTVTVLLAEEDNPPPGVERLSWILLSSCRVETAAQAAELLRWYLCRWQAEIFFRMLKSGCRVEELQLEQIERLEPALAFYLIIAWRVLYLTLLGRTCPELPCDVVFALEEWQAVYIVTTRQPPPQRVPIVPTAHICTFKSRSNMLNLTMCIPF
jgi:Transposase Tn5 dimerisation domain